MATELGRGYITIVPKTSSQFKSIANTAASEFSSAFKGGIGSLGVAAGNLIASGIRSTIGGLNSLINEAIGQADVFTRMPIMLETLGFAADQSQAALDKLNKGLMGFPTLVSEGASAVARMTASNGDLDKSVDIFLALNDAVMAGGAASQVQAAAIEQFQQAIAKGKPDRIEFRSFMQAFPGVMKQVASVMGMTTSQLQEAFSGGKVTMDEFAEALVSLETNAAPGFATLKEQALAATTGMEFGFKTARKSIVQGITDIILAMDVKRTAGFFTTFGQGMQGMLDALVPVGKEIGNILGNIIDGLVAKIPAAQQKMAEVASRITASLQSIDKDGISNLLKVITPTIKLFTTLAGIIGNTVLKVVELVASNEALAKTIGIVIALFVSLKAASSAWTVVTSAAKHARDVWWMTTSVINDASYRMRIFHRAATDTSGFINGPLINSLHGLTSAFPGLLAQLEATTQKWYVWGQWAATPFVNIGNSVKGVATGAIKSMVSGISTAFSAIAGVAVTAGRAMSAAFKAVPLPVKIIIGVVAALVALFVTLFKTNEGFRNSVISAWNSIKSAIEPVVNVIGQAFTHLMTIVSDVFNQLGPTIADTINVLLPIVKAVLRPFVEFFQSMLTSSFGDLFNSLTQVATTLGPVLAQSFGQIKDTFVQLAPIFQNIAQVIGNILVVALQSLVQIGATLITSLLPVLANLIALVVNTVAALVPVLMQLVSAILPVIATLVTVIVGVIGSVLAAILPVIIIVISSLAEILARILPIITSIIEMVINMIVPVIQMIAPIIGIIVNLIAELLGVIAPILEFLTPIIQLVMTFVSVVLQTVITVIQGIIQLITGDFQGAAETFGNLFNTIGEFIGNVMNNIGQAVGQGIQNVINWFANLPGTILGALGDLGGILWDAGTNIINGLLNGLKSAFNGVKDFISGIGSWIAEHKGPRAYDLKLLVPNGKWIMQSLSRGLQIGANDVYNTLGQITTSLGSQLVGATPLNVNATYGSNNGVVGSGGTAGVVNNFYMDKWTLNDDDAMRETAMNYAKEVERKAGLYA